MTWQILAAKKIGLKLINHSLQNNAKDGDLYGSMKFAKVYF